MNISNLIKMISDVQPAASRTLELRPGQTVRAQVMEQTGKDEALLQINGTQVIAKMDSSVQAGQTVMLQVTGETEDGMLVMKKQERNAKAVTVSDDQWKEIAAKFGLGGKEGGASALARELRAADVALTPETAAGLEKAAVASACRRKSGALAEGGCRCYSTRPSGNRSQRWRR